MVSTSRKLLTSLWWNLWTKLGSHLSLRTSRDRRVLSNLYEEEIMPLVQPFSHLFLFFCTKSCLILNSFKSFFDMILSTVKGWGKSLELRLSSLNHSNSSTTGFRCKLEVLYDASEAVSACHLRWDNTSDFSFSLLQLHGVTVHTVSVHFDCEWPWMKKLYTQHTSLCIASSAASRVYQKYLRDLRSLLSELIAVAIRENQPRVWCASAARSSRKWWCWRWAWNRCW